MSDPRSFLWAASVLAVWCLLCGAFRISQLSNSECDDISKGRHNGVMCGSLFLQIVSSRWPSSLDKAVGNWDENKKRAHCGMYHLQDQFSSTQINRGWEIVVRTVLKIASFLQTASLKRMIFHSSQATFTLHFGLCSVPFASCHLWVI